MRTIRWQRKRVNAPGEPRVGWLLPAAAGAVAVAWAGQDTLLAPGPAVALIVVFAAFAGGVFAGLAAAAVASCYFAIVLSSPGHFLSYTADNLRRLIVWVATLPIAGLMVGMLRQQAGRVFEIATENAVLLDRVRARELAISALHESECRYRRLFDGAPVGLLWASPGGQIVHANAVAAEAFGFAAPDGMVGKDLRDLWVDPMGPCAARGALAATDATATSVHVRRADGTTASIQAVVRPTRDAVQPVSDNGHATSEPDGGRKGGDGIAGLLMIVMGTSGSAAAPLEAQRS